MSEYDELYLIKNPFFIGSYEKAISEHESIVLEETDTLNLEKKTFYLIRAYLSVAEYGKADEALNKHIATIKCSEEEKQRFTEVVKFFIEFIKTGVRLLLINRNMMRIL